MKGDLATRIDSARETHDATQGIGGLAVGEKFSFGLRRDFAQKANRRVDGREATNLPSMIVLQDREIKTVGVAFERLAHRNAVFLFDLLVDLGRQLDLV